MAKAKQQWGAEMERLISKYNLDCFLDSELDSESDEGEQYHYEHIIFENQLTDKIFKT